MKYLLLLLSLTLAATTFAQRPRATADDAFKEFQAVSGASLTVLNDRARVEKMPQPERDALIAGAAELTAALGEKFLADFPADARRWQVAGSLLRVRREFGGDRDRRAAWLARRSELRDQLVAAPDADEKLVASVLELAVYGALGGQWAQPGESADFTAAEKFADLMAAKAPASDRRKFAEQHYLEELIGRGQSAIAETRARRLAAAGAANLAVANMAAGLVEKITAQREPLVLKFTALDGTAVDLAQLRGKVVLLDFWATWCVPCMQEMPEVKRVYAAYHDRGFEIIGISFDAAPRDPAKPRSHEKTAEQVTAFLVKEGMPWPQHYDGKYWDNEIGRRFSIASIPAGFLLGPDGRIASLDNHGTKLEANVKKLLGL